MKRIFAVEDYVGTVTNPLPSAYQNILNGGLILFLSNILRFIFVIAGIYAFFNFIIAGFTYMSAGGDAKSLASAWERIWQSLVGLIVIVSSFAMAALIGQLFFGDATYILNPQIYGPK